MKMGSVERVPIEIPGVQVMGEFPIKRFMEAICNAHTKQHGVKLTATVRPSAGNEWEAELGKERLAGACREMWA